MAYKLEIQPCFPLYGWINRGATLLPRHFCLKQVHLTTSAGAGDKSIPFQTQILLMLSSLSRSQRQPSCITVLVPRLIDTIGQGKTHWGWKANLRLMTGHFESTWQFLPWLLSIHGWRTVNALKPSREIVKRTFIQSLPKNSLIVHMIQSMFVGGGIRGSQEWAQPYLSEPVEIRGRAAMPTSPQPRRGRGQVVWKHRFPFRGVAGSAKALSPPSCVCCAWMKIQTMKHGFCYTKKGKLCYPTHMTEHHGF